MTTLTDRARDMALVLTVRGDDPVAKFLHDLATEVDRLSAEVERLRNRTGDYSEARS